MGRNVHTKNILEKMSGEKFSIYHLLATIELNIYFNNFKPSLKLNKCIIFSTLKSFITYNKLKIKYICIYVQIVFVS